MVLHNPLPPKIVNLLFGFRVSGFGFRISGFGFRVSGFWFRGSGFGLQVAGPWFSSSLADRLPPSSAWSLLRGLRFRVGVLGLRVWFLGCRVSSRSRVYVLGRMQTNLRFSVKGEGDWN